MQDLTDDDLPPTPFELEQRRHVITTAQNERRERLRLRKANQARGHDEPKPGMTLHVQLDGSITKRNRAGIRFERGKRVAVLVVDAEEVDVAAQQAAGAAVVDVYGAERILEDSALHVFEQPGGSEDLEELQRAKAALEEELRVTRAENADLQARMRAARMAAKDPGDGRPSRLPAAARVVAGDGVVTSEFGAPAADKDKK